MPKVNVFTKHRAESLLMSDLGTEPTE